MSEAHSIWAFRSLHGRFYSNEGAKVPKMPRVTKVSTRLKVQEKAKHNTKRKT